MDDIAELGYAAHWKYKSGVREDESELDTWMNTIKDILAHPEPNALDFLDTIKLNLYSSEIYVFTPKGDLLTLPSGATVLDMAFAIHSELGLHCMAGKISHKLVPLEHKLESGDQVEIITSGSQHPKEEWMGFCHTAKAKTRLKNYLRKEGLLTEENEVKKDEKKKGGGNKKSIVKKLLRNPFASKKKDSDERRKEPIDRSQVYILYPDEKNPNYQLDDCCAPLPGDDVLGFVNEDEEVVLHKVNCPYAMKLKSAYGKRLVVTKWGGNAPHFIASISVEGIDRLGILEEITDLVSKRLGMNIRSLNINANNEVFTCEMSLKVDTAETVEKLCENLRDIKGIKFAKRIS